MSIDVQNLSFSYGQQESLKDVSFSAEMGKALFVLGANGAGKTTLFRCILGLVRGYGGKIFIDGAESQKLAPKALAQRVAYIPQSHGGNFGYTVLDMVLMGTAHGVAFYSVPRARETAIACEALELLGVQALAGKSFTHLSGGEQQLVLIARALAQRADTLLFDEPTANLDYGNQWRLLSTVKDLVASGRTVILTTHNPQHALTCADEVLALDGGRVAALGPPDSVLTPKLIERLYGVRTAITETTNGPVLSPSFLSEGGNTGCSNGTMQASNT